MFGAEVFILGEPMRLEGEALVLMLGDVLMCGDIELLAGELG